MKVTLRPGGGEFDVEPGQTVLEAALGSGLALPHGCVNGSCGNCAARVVDGEVERVRFHDFAFTEVERREGYALLCSVTPRTDAVIECRAAAGPGEIPAQSLRARLYRDERLGPGMRLLHLKVMRARVLRFLAGQRAVLRGAGLAPVELPIASCPCDGLNLLFHVDEALAPGLSGPLPRNAKFQVDGPRGGFLLDEGSGRPVVFAACDSGFAPVNSLVEHAINLELPQTIDLFRYASAPGGDYLDNYCRSIADALDEVSYRLLHGPGAAPDDAAACPVERFAQIVAARCGDLGACDVYLSGPPAFNAAVRGALGAAAHARVLEHDFTRAGS